MYKFLIRPFFFLFDPEKIHGFTNTILGWISSSSLLCSVLSFFYLKEDKRLEKELFGIKFKNPVGLAAGFDKNASFFKAIAAYGFSFVEIGTVTPTPQKGNPKKRLFRLKEDEAIINRMGFNNDGVDVVVNRLKKRNSQVIIGGNIGKNNDCNEDAYTEDYLYCLEKLHPYVDYFTLNISCPNVGDLTKLNDKSYQKELITALQELNASFDKKKPLLLKISPDLKDKQLDDILDLMATTDLDGIIASNTTTHRKSLLTSNREVKNIGKGGLSGKPLKKRSNYVIRYLAEKSNKSFPIIGVGGIMNAQDALDKLDAGADLVQIYSGFIYEGPSIVKSINKAILSQYEMIEHAKMTT